MEIYVYIIIAIIILVFFVIQTASTRIRAKEYLRIKIENSWGQKPTREYSYDEFEKITQYFKTKKSKEAYIDDITWNDLDMDTVFMLLNNTQSSVGEEYLYKLLRTPSFEKSELLERDRIISFFETNKKKAFELEKIFSKIGYTRKVSFYEYIFRLKDLGKGKPLFHSLFPSALIIAIISIFFIPQYMLAPLIAILAVNVIFYYKFKAKISAYYICFGYLVKIISNAENIYKLNFSELDEYNKVLKEKCNKLKMLKKGIVLLGANNVSGSLGDIIMDYIRIIFHVDIIKFNQMLLKTINNLDEVDELYEELGKIEAYIGIASYRNMVPYYVKPELYEGLKREINFSESYHPLIENPIPNSLSEKKGVLLTGSNASGKSTFLKTTAINAILAQTIYTCLAKEYSSGYFSVYSSMALTDSLESNESYYIVEIKSLKRILDASKQTDKNILCFIDEVLRGTNTIERIAASGHILKSLDKENVICFAATHDFELTHMLEKNYSNYHFSEDVIENDIMFSYKLNHGRAQTRNAIKLLSIIGYDEEVIKAAEKSAKRFENEGLWTLENL